MSDTPLPRSRRFAWFPTDRVVPRTRTGTDPAGLLGLVTPPTRERRRSEQHWELVAVLQARIDDLLGRIEDLRATVADLREERSDMRAQIAELRKRLDEK